MTTKFFIDNEMIEKLLEDAKNASESEINEILQKAENFQGLTEYEVAVLINLEDKKYLERIFSIAKKIKQNIYGERVVMFAPIYVSDYCINKCEYCGFRCDNKFDRKKLNMDELREEVRLLEKMGHKRLALEAGEHPSTNPIEYILECIDTIYNMKFENGEIRRINVNIAATTVENYKKLKDIEIGTYILFQETYHKETYERVHISGPKKDYFYHTTAFDRAMEAGIEDVGGGALFGLYDYRYEVLGLMIHNKHLEESFGVGFHTISVPRLCEAEGVSRENYKYLINDEEFKKIVAVLRLAVPYTGIIISTRETKEMRAELINLGVSQISAGSAVEVGGYTLREKKGSQFTVADERPARDVIYWLMQENLIPSFCTACYRMGRTGDRFMQLAKTGNIKNVCLPNAIMSLKEFSLDYGDKEFSELADKIIKDKINDIGNPKILETTKENLQKLENGERDLFL